MRPPPVWVPVARTVVPAAVVKPVAVESLWVQYDRAQLPLVAVAVGVVWAVVAAVSPARAWAAMGLVVSVPRYAATVRLPLEVAPTSTRMVVPASVAVATRRQTRVVVLGPVTVSSVVHPAGSVM